MVRKNPIEHAEHNERVCNFLSKKVEYGDWIITTAFYSAIHYVRHLMLPGVFRNGKPCESFEDLFSDQKFLSEGLHGFQLRYVKDNCRPIYIDYKQLHDLCNTARYVEYNYPREASNQAKGKLEKIKSYVKSVKS